MIKIEGDKQVIKIIQVNKDECLELEDLYK